MKLSVFDKRVEIYAPTEATSSTTGEVTESFALSTTVWMQMDSESGSETLIQDKEYTKYPTFWICRSGHTITEQYKLKYNGNYYDILGIDEVDRKFIKIKSVRSA